MSKVLPRNGRGLDEDYFQAVSNSVDCLFGGYSRRLGRVHPLELLIMLKLVVDDVGAG